MINFSQYPGNKAFERSCLPYLLGTVQRFFGGVVTFDPAPIQNLKQKFSIDVTENPRRGSYICSDGSAIILGRVHEEATLKAVFSIHISQTSFKYLANLLKAFDGALAATLVRSSSRKFQEKPHEFGDELIEQVICRFFSRDLYDIHLFKHLIEIFHSLANLKFEGRNFTTGLIITNAFHEYAKKGEHTREGTMYRLASEFSLSPDQSVHKRFWYLADGQTSYYMCNRNLQIRSLFITQNSRQALNSFVDDFALSKTIKGGDALFRVTSQSEFSILSSEGIEFNYKEGRWRARNLFQIAEIIKEVLTVEDVFIQSFMYYVLYLSRRRQSSILWVPKNTNKIKDFVLSRHKFTETPFSILEETHTQSLLRLLSSDGTSIIGLDGKLISFGSVVDVSKITVDGIKGTGESVAEILGNNGLSVKVSQDGTIKIFIGNGSPAIII
ncbi:MAG: hypothetical protein ACAH17_00665 [Candidatus Paceibacterota bacterium]